MEHDLHLIRRIREDERPSGVRTCEPDARSRPPEAPDAGARRYAKVWDVVWDENARRLEAGWR